jgi:2-phospho-L-lactate guanylyltransferase
MWAIVPMKPFAEAKRRLASLLSAEARMTFARDMLLRTLNVLAHARGVERIAVVSRDEQVLALAHARGVWPVRETAAGLNDALEQATRAAMARGAGAVLVVPADLPCLVTGDVERIVALGHDAPCVVLAPARRDQGTNALLMNPTGLLRYAFGASSFIEHQRRAREAGARVEVYQSAGAAFDVDEPADWHAYLEQLQTQQTR